MHSLYDITTNKKRLEKYGEELLNEISEAGYLDGITVAIDKNGEIDIPESDIRRAIKEHNGKKSGDFEWD